MTLADISILIPVYDEQDSLDQLHREVSDVARKGNFDLEMIFIDDGSSDSSWSVLTKLAELDKRVKCIRLRRNFGKASALQAGIDISTGRLIMTMDADLQDDPAELPAMMALLDEGFDLVSGWKKNRKDPLDKRLPSKGFNWLVSWLSGVRLHDHNCGLKLYRREIFDDVKLYGERHRFIPVLAATSGWKVTEMVVNHRPRIHGVSKYNWRRLPKGFLDLITISFLTGYNQRPQHLLGGSGLGASGLGPLGMVWMAIYWALRMMFFPDWEPLHRRPIVLYSLGGLLLGAQLLCMGFLAELITSHNMQNSGNKTFSVKETRNTETTNSVAAVAGELERKDGAHDGTLGSPIKSMEGISQGKPTEDASE